jgi:mono/diheme cytochrome c family protein
LSTDSIIPFYDNMRRIHIYSTFILLILTALLFYSCNNSSNKTSNESLTAKINRGDYLVNTVCNCMHCHAERDFTKFSGPVIQGTEGKGGQLKARGIYATNITPTVLGNWTDDEITRAITAGITKTGDTLFPLMPYGGYTYLSKDDAASIVAYLRTLKPLANSVPKRNLAYLPSGMLGLLYRNLYLNNIDQTKNQLLPDIDSVKGKYLVSLAGCNGCHTPFNNRLLVFYSDSILAGGALYKVPESNFKVRSSNLTPDTATGIGSWTEEIFLSKFKNYREQKAYDYNPGKYNTDMPWSIVAKMTDDDIKSIYSYLRTIKPVHNKLEKWPQ